MHMRRALLVATFHLLATLDLARAFNFTFLTIPAQCEELSIAISGGTPPYRLLIIPIGTLLTPPEIRTIVDRNITATSDSFVFNYPAASQFVAMMSDATGIGTGGTSAIIAVGGGTKTDCLPSSASAPKFYLYLDPATPTQCGSMNVSWSANAVPPVSVYTLVIGGQSGALAIPDGASSIEWTTNIRVNTTFMFVAGDSRGAGTGGSSELLTVGPGSSACINANSPSSTQRPPAGGINTAGGVSTPTSVPSSGSGSSTNVGAIVGS
ncbi:SKG6 domain protein [Ceratobasidium sp. AG-Ba]|nr:SKG6 domain protein [Ceratobasidium sp. AG-Ba]